MLGRLPICIIKAPVILPRVIKFLHIMILMLVSIGLFQLLVEAGALYPFKTVPIVNIRQQRLPAREVFVTILIVSFLVGVYKLIIMLLERKFLLHFMLVHALKLIEQT